MLLQVVLLNSQLKYFLMFMEAQKDTQRSNGNSLNIVKVSHSQAIIKFSNVKVTHNSSLILGIVLNTQDTKNSEAVFSHMRRTEQKSLLICSI